MLMTLPDRPDSYQNWRRNMTGYRDPLIWPYGVPLCDRRYNIEVDGRKAFRFRSREERDAELDRLKARNALPPKTHWMAG